MVREPRQLAMRVSLGASVFMLAGKLLAYFLTHSTAMFADAAESVVHGVATGFAAFSLWYAARPADTEHPYGHGRIVYFSTGFEGALVLAASVTVMRSGVLGLMHEPPLERIGLGLAIAGVLAAFNCVLGATLVRIGRRHNALVLVANGKHVLSDFWTTAAAIVGLLLVKLTGHTWLDPLAALLIGAWIMFTGISLIRTSIAGLMDQLDPELATKVEAGLSDAVRRGRIANYHEVRCRRLNDEIFIDAHLLVPGETQLDEAHHRATEVENTLQALFPDQRVHIVTHVEPLAHDAAHPKGHPHRLDEAPAGAR
ncbi:MAG TPA: cation diffusion facilitator family transporter [Phycisphaerae bacterium]|nr:cation diffusion facilitator family transporter [Phycisphaerae bacterium]